MDFDLSADQTALRDAARDLLDNECTSAHVRRAAEIGQSGVGRVENESDRTDGPKRNAQEFGPEKTFTDSCARQ